MKGSLQCNRSRVLCCISSAACVGHLMVFRVQGGGGNSTINGKRKERFGVQVMHQYMPIGLSRCGQWGCWWLSRPSFPVHLLKQDWKQFMGKSRLCWLVLASVPRPARHRPWGIAVLCLSPGMGHTSPAPPLPSWQFWVQIGGVSYLCVWCLVLLFQILLELVRVASERKQNT